jgi:hypothetical protein
LLANTIGISEDRLNEVIRETHVKRIIESDDIEKADCAAIWLMVIYGWTYKYAIGYRDRVLRRLHDSDGHTEHQSEVREPEARTGKGGRRWCKTLNTDA